jgi:peptidoglycan/LPS O-acetylase OafA/YrhL
MIEQETLLVTRVRPLNWQAVSDWLAGKLARVTSSGELIPEIDGLRFIAISSVVFHHLMSIYLQRSGRSAVPVHSPAEWAALEGQSWLVPLAYSGHFGVNLFFAISGFILALPFAKRSFADRPAPELKAYYLRRVTRIEPPYAICLTLFFLTLWLGQQRDPVALFPHLLASLFYLHGLVYGRHSPINSVAWSLEIEIQFYLLVPWLVKLFRLRNVALRRGLLLALIVGGGCCSQHLIYPSGSARLMLSLANFLHYFLVGFLLADLYLTGWLREAGKYWLGDLLTLASGVALVAVLYRYGQFYFALPLLVLLFYLGFFLGKWSNALVRLRWLVLIGGMCYTYYLYHMPIVSGLLGQTAGWTAATWPLAAAIVWQTLLVCPLVLLLCSWWYVVTEKPFMTWSLAHAKPWRAPGRNISSVKTTEG